jgi:hypothetical protein
MREVEGIYLYRRDWFSGVSFFLERWDVPGASKDLLKWEVRYMRVQGYELEPL